MTAARPAPPAAPRAELCPLCAHRFVPSGWCHGSCPLARGCSLVRCPNCRFEFPPTRSRVAAAAHALHAWSRRWRRT